MLLLERCREQEYPARPVELGRVVASRQHRWRTGLHYSSFSSSLGQNSALKVWTAEIVATAACGMTMRIPYQLWLLRPGRRSSKGCFQAYFCKHGLGSDQRRVDDWQSKEDTV